VTTPHSPCLPVDPIQLYRVCVSISSLGPDEIRAAAEVHSELGPDYKDAVVESFLDRVNKEIDTRVDQRLAAAQQPALPAQQKRTFALAIVSIALGIPLTAIIGALGNGSQATELVFVWVAIAVINVAYAIGYRPPASRR
jgi:CHASE3 domain sensor protein